LLDSKTILISPPPTSLLVQQGPNGLQPTHHSFTTLITHIHTIYHILLNEPVQHKSTSYSAIQEKNR
jgi:hypothetical protein